MTFAAHLTLTSQTATIMPALRSVAARKCWGHGELAGTGSGMGGRGSCEELCWLQEALGPVSHHGMC